MPVVHHGHVPVVATVTEEADVIVTNNAIASKRQT